MAMTIKEVLDRCNQAIKEPSDIEIYKAMVLLHSKLSEPKWAIEDEALRDEMEKLTVQMTVANYMKDRRTK